MDKEVRYIEFYTSNNDNGEYKVEVIWDSMVYVRESESSYLPGFYYSVSKKRYLEEKNTWKPTSTVQHLKKLISLFYKDHPDKPIAKSLAINSISPIVRPGVKLTKLAK